MKSRFSKAWIVITAFVPLLAVGCVEEPIVDVVEKDELAICGAPPQVTLWVEPDAKVGEPGGIRVHWTAPVDHYSGDLLFMYREGAPDSDLIQFGYIGGFNESSGVNELTVPSTFLLDPRPIEFRYFENYCGFGKLATSNAVQLSHTYAVDLRPGGS